MEEKTYKQSGKTLTSQWQQQVLDYVASKGTHGVTDGEAQDYFGKGHGSTSSALSTLHKRGFLERLREKRNRFTVYVLPQHVGDRETLPPMTNTGEVSQNAELKREITALRKKLEKVEKLVEPGWRSYSYTRNDLMDDIRRALL